MPAYSSATLPAAIYPGNQVPLVNNADSDTGVTKTMRVSLAQVPTNPPTLTLINTTDQTAAVEVAATDTDADYVPLSENGAAITAVTNTAVAFTCAGPWLRCTFTSAPASGSLTICR